MAHIEGIDWDYIYGFEMEDLIHGFETEDFIYGFYGDDDIYGYGGDDYIYAGYGDDWVAGGFGVDFLYGESGNDVLYGQYGDDDLYGGSGSDKIYGGGQDDWLFGGRGRDYLSGGSGSDSFFFKRGTSGLSSSTVDVITDWDGAYDFVDMPVRGTYASYDEAVTTAVSIAQAADQANTWFPDPTVQHVFLYNPDIDKGFLVSDLNSDGAFETGVVLNKAGFASDFDYFNIL